MGEEEDGEPAEERDLGPELVGLWCHQQRRGDGRAHGEHDTRDATSRHGRRIGDHEEGVDEEFGREDDDPVVVRAAHGGERPIGGHTVAGSGDERLEDGERDEEGHGQGPDLRAPDHVRSADEDDRVGDDHPHVERRPPEVEGLQAAIAEDQEGEHQADVRRIEDVLAAIPNQILLDQGECGDAGKHVEVVRGPGLVRGRAHDAHEERYAAAREEGTSGECEDAVTAERDGDLDDRARQDRGEDLPHTQGPVEHELAEGVKAPDDGRDS